MRTVLVDANGGPMVAVSFYSTTARCVALPPIVVPLAALEYVLLVAMTRYGFDRGARIEVL